jgi:hydroxyacylglutathione hydrolase
MRHARILHPQWLLTLAALLLSLVGCATSHSERTLSAGITVHTFRREYTNAHLVTDGKNAFLFDAGLEQNATMLAQDIRDVGVAPEKLRAILLSHGHADHAGGASYFKRTFGTPIIAGAQDRAMLARGSNDHLCPTERTSRLERDQNASFSPIVADREVEGEVRLEPLTGIEGTLVSLPGHTEGSLVALVDDGVFVGDLFRGSILGSSAEVHFYMCDLADNQADIRHLLTTLAPNASTFFTGHFGPVLREAVTKRFLGPTR